jgi:nitrate reductase NapE
MAVSANHELEKRAELRVFLLLAVVLVPVISVLLVGGFGLIVWIYQLIAGPPGPPH